MGNEKDTKGIGERILKQIYADNIEKMPTFDEKMQKHIQEELEKMKQEYLEYIKKKKDESLNEVVKDEGVI